MERQYRGRAFIRRVLDWYHGPSRFIQKCRQQALARRNAAVGRHKLEVCEHAWNPQSTAITCVPSGTVSQLVDAASGIHTGTTTTL